MEKYTITISTLVFIFFLYDFIFEPIRTIYGVYKKVAYLFLLCRCFQDFLFYFGLTEHKFGIITIISTILMLPILVGTFIFYFIDDSEK